MDNLEDIIIHQDSIISNHTKIEIANQEKFLLAQQEIKRERKRAKKFKRQRNVTIGTVIIVAALYVFTSVN